MSKKLKSSYLRVKNTVIVLIFIGILLVGKTILGAKAQKIETNLADFSLEERLAISQENTLLSLTTPLNPEPKVVKKVNVIITGYSSNQFETDDSPYITAAGTWVREGVIANNGLPLGTKVRIPELYEDKIFVVEDRMSWKKGKYHVDVWFSSYQEAKSFGAQRTYIEVLEG